jgi:hypothetical protein
VLATLVLFSQHPTSCSTVAVDSPYSRAAYVRIDQLPRPEHPSLQCIVAPVHSRHSMQEAALFLVELHLLSC